MTWTLGKTEEEVRELYKDEDLDPDDFRKLYNRRKGITRDEFVEIYGDYIDPDIFEREHDSEQDLIKNFLPSKLWRINHLYSIIDKDGNRITFLMNKSQHLCYASILKHPRLIVLKSRQQGISTFWLVYAFDDALVQEHMNLGLMAQGKDEAGTLLDRIKVAWDHVHPNILDFLQTHLNRNNSEKLKFSNGNTIFIRTSFRSATLQFLHISEYGKICAEKPKRAKETKTGTLQAISGGNIVVVESTAEGVNDYKYMWDKAIEREAKIAKGELAKYSPKDFKSIFLSWLFDPDCESSVYERPNKDQIQYFDDLEALLHIKITEAQRNFWIQQYHELGEDTYQEYPATPEEAFRKANDGTYYAHAYAHFIAKGNREIIGLYKPDLEVNVSLDLGMDEADLFTMIYFQRFQDEWRIIDEYKNHGFGLDHYVDQMRATKYRINKVICPHDIAVRELGTGISREDRLYELGVHDIVTVDKTGSVAADIELVRKMVKHVWIDPVMCPYTVGCFKNYTKVWDDKMETWRAKAAHDKWSHGADALRAMFKSGIGRIEREDPNPWRNPTNVVGGLAL